MLNRIRHCLSSKLSIRALFKRIYVLGTLFSFLGVPAHGLKAVEASVIVASVEGEVLSISVEDEFQVTLDSSSVGKKIEETYENVLEKYNNWGTVTHDIWKRQETAET